MRNDEGAPLAAERRQGSTLRLCGPASRSGCLCPGAPECSAWARRGAPMGSDLLLPHFAQVRAPGASLGTATASQKRAVPGPETALDHYAHEVTRRCCFAYVPVDRCRALHRGGISSSRVPGLSRSPHPRPPPIGGRVETADFADLRDLWLQSMRAIQRRIDGRK